MATYKTDFPDATFDGNTLADVMNALAQAPGQVILQSPNKPTKSYDLSWRVIDLEDKDESLPN